jgi:hypothetical protein
MFAVSCPPFHLSQNPRTPRSALTVRPCKGMAAFHCTRTARGVRRALLGSALGGPVAGRLTFPWPILALLAAAVVASTAAADTGSDVLRLKHAADNRSPATLKADKIYTWTDGSEVVYALVGNVEIGQDRLRITTGRAVVWIDAEDYRKHRPTEVHVYTDAKGTKKLVVDTTGSDPQEPEKAFVEFVTPVIGRISGEVNSTALTTSEQYRSALAARGRAAPPPKELPPSPDEPARGKVQATQFPPANPDVPPDAPAVKGSTVVPVPLSETRTVWIAPRTTRPMNVYPMANAKERAFIVTGGIKLIATFTTGAIKSLEVEADQVVIWKRDGEVNQTVDAMQTEEGAKDASGIELYLTGNVVIRFLSPKDKTPQGVLLENRTVRADRIYYDLDHHKAISINADLEFTRERFTNTGHVVAREIDQLSSTEFTALESILHASRLPSDPGFEIAMDRAEIYKEPLTERRTIFGTAFRNRTTGDVVTEEPEILEAHNMSMWARDIPFFYLPYARTNLNDPFGPFQGVTFRQDRIFGFQVYTTWDMLKLIGLTPLENEKWNLQTDFLSARGPGLGSNYSLSSPKFFGMDAPYQTQVKGYFIYDKGEDQLGGPREMDSPPTKGRGRFLWQHQQNFTLDQADDLTVQAQFALLSDRNYLEQYYQTEYESGPNQETFLWVKYQTGNAAATFLVEPDTGRNWVSETHWLPRFDGYLLGQSIFDRFTYHTWGSIGYAQLDTARNPAEQFPLGYDNGLPPPEQGANTARIDWMQKISAPFDAGPFRVVPYAVTDAAYYTQDISGSSTGRLYGGAGLKASIPLSRLYADVESEMFDVKGLYHKNVFSVNYFAAATNANWNQLPQLDRLDDDATDSAWRDITPWQPTYTFLNPTNALILGNGSYNIYDPRAYAVRRLVDTSPETLGNIQEIQLDWRQRWQTKRGYPGLEHTVDWFTLDMSASIFPVPNRDNFGNSVGFLEYSMQWNVGDRTAVYSNAWVDPFNFGARYWEVGASFSRDDRTAFAITYKNTDPLQSRLVAASATYVFSPKYAMTAATAYDFGYQSSLSNSLLFTRVGTDVMITVGFTYNNIVKNFGMTLNIVPNLLGSQSAPVTTGDRVGSGALGGSGPMSGR